MKNIKNYIWESFNDAELMTQDLFDWWEEHCTEDAYNSRSKFIKDMKAMVKKQNDTLVQDAFDYLTNECEWDEKDVTRWEKDLVQVLSQLAQDEIDELLDKF